MTSTNPGRTAGAIAAVLVLAAPLAAGERSRSAAGTGTPSTDRIHGRSAEGAASAFEWMMRNSESKAMPAPASEMLPGNPSNVEPVECAADPCARSGVCGTRNKLRCGMNFSRAEFDAKHGPFARALGNFEDLELMNTNDVGGGFCGIGGTELVDCTDSGPDTTGFFCAGPAISAGDLLPGFEFDNSPQHGGATSLDILATGRGFTASNTRFVLANYFADKSNVTFLSTTNPTCAASAPLPSAVGLGLQPLFGTGARIWAELEDGTCFVGDTAPFLPAQSVSFIGLECPAAIRQVTWGALQNSDNLGLDDLSWGATKAEFTPGTCPLTDENIFRAVECIELKVDTLVESSSINFPIP